MRWLANCFNMVHCSFGSVQKIGLLANSSLLTSSNIHSPAGYVRNRPRDDEIGLLTCIAVHTFGIEDQSHLRSSMCEQATDRTFQQQVARDATVCPFTQA